MGWVHDVKFDSVVVLGGTVQEDMVERMHLGMDIVRKNDSPLVLVGTPKEVQFMRNIAVNHVGPDKIMSDDRCKTTIDNAYYAKIICSNIKSQSIAMITSNYHLERALLIFKTVFGPQFHIVPFGCKNMAGEDILKREKTMLKLIPFLSVFIPGDHEAIKNTADAVSGTLSEKLNNILV